MDRKIDVKSELVTLASQIAEHPALNNQFYDAWTNRPFDTTQLQIFSRNYGAWIKSFPSTLALLFMSLDDSAAQTEIAATLHSEMGYGNPEKAHWKLFDCFMKELANNMGIEGRLDRFYLETQSKMLPTTTLDLLPETNQLIQGEKTSYSHQDQRTAVGAQLALEWQAYSMLSKLYEGAQRQYAPLWKSKIAFNRAAEYFLIHLVAEKDHEKESLEAATQYTKNNADLNQIKQGFYSHLELIQHFWEGMYNKMNFD